MPSSARQLFKAKLLPDVNKLLDAHAELTHEGRGRRHLGYITRSGVIMLCAAWELYAETVCLEAIDFLCVDPLDPDFLPNEIKGKLSSAVKKNQHEFGVLKLCHDGWKSVYREEADKVCERLNTPKFSQVSELYRDWLGIDPLELEESWRNTKEQLNAFVELRGEIAHRGADAQYVKRDRLKELVELIDNLSVDTDNFLSDHLKSISFSKRRPWHKIPLQH